MRRAHRHDEFHRNDLRALVQPLEECVLAVGARCAPDRRGAGVAEYTAIALHRLAIALQRELLQVGGEAPERVRIGHHDALRVTQHLRVPVIDQSQQHRQIAFERRVPEVSVHARRAGEQIREGVPAAADRDRDTCRGPEREPTAHPVPHRQHVAARDAERARGVDVGADGNEVLRQRRAAAQVRRKPFAGRLCIPERLDGREGLGGDDEQCGCRVEAGERTGEMFRIDIGHEGDVDAIAGRGARAGERFAHHRGSEVGAADTEVDDVADRPSRGAQPQAAAQLNRQRAHAHLRGADPRDDVGAVDGERRITRPPQRRVERGAQLREIDLLAGEERRDPRLQIALAGVREQQVHRVLREALFRPVGEPFVPFERKTCAASGIGVEQRGQRMTGEQRAVIEQRLPGVGESGRGHCW